MTESNFAKGYSHLVELTFPFAGIREGEYLETHPFQVKR